MFDDYSFWAFFIRVIYFLVRVTLVLIVITNFVFILSQGHAGANFETTLLNNGPRFVTSRGDGVHWDT